MCDRVSFTECAILGYKLTKRTVVDTLRDRLENFDIERSSATVVSVVFVFGVTGDALCSIGSRESDSGRSGYPGNDLTGIE